MSRSGKLGLILSGGGSRAAYQAGALKALAATIEADTDSVSVLVGTSIGAVNVTTLSGCMRDGLSAGVETLQSIWRERTYRNTFLGSPSRAFLKATQVAMLRYSSPGPVSTSLSIFDPTPLRDRIDGLIAKNNPENLPDENCITAVMATIEGKERTPLLFVCSPQRIDEQQFVGASFSVSYVPRLSAAHGLASSALPSVLPPVELNVEAGQVRLVDGGISDNFPIDPAVRLGADRTILIDVSGRRWWFDHYKEPHDTRPKWEVPSLDDTFCMYPNESCELVNNFGLGEVLKQTVGRSTRDFIEALGPTWPIFKILKHRMGEKLAYEVMSYVALHPGYFEALMDIGYRETLTRLKSGLPFHPGTPSETI